VVQYIVEQALRPVLDAAVADKPGDADTINMESDVVAMQPTTSLDPAEHM
jgi:hypothetical protein